MMGRMFLNRYKVIQLLGEGGMGKVYLAVDVAGRREVVVKVLHDKIASQAAVREKFQQEMEFMARFQHPNVVALYDASINDPNGPCIVMEYIPGDTLDRVLHHQMRLPPVRVASLLLPLCKALFAAHQAGVIHRDLKPANLMVVNTGMPNETLKVMDFGLSALANALFIPKERLDNPEAYFSACGTPDYMCPEQIRGDELDHRSDLYSVGVILYQLLTGRLPFARATSQKVMLAQAEDKPPPFAQMGIRNVPPAVEAVVMHCMMKFSVERPGTARDLMERFEKALGVKFSHPDDWVMKPSRSSVCIPVVPGGSAVRRAIDPSAVVHTMEAWMPERIAVVKLQGFVSDVGGQVVESVPGRIRVQLCERKPVSQGAGLGFLSKLGLGARQEGRPLIELEMLMEKREAGNATKLHITAVYKPATGGRSMAMAPGWKQRCDELHRDLRAYLMGRA